MVKRRMAGILIWVAAPTIKSLKMHINGKYGFRFGPGTSLGDSR